MAGAYGYGGDAINQAYGSGMNQIYGWNQQSALFQNQNLALVNGMMGGGANIMGNPMMNFGGGGYGGGVNPALLYSLMGMLPMLMMLLQQLMQQQQGRGQGYPGQGYPGQGYPGQGYPGQGYPGQGFPYPGPGRNCPPCCWPPQPPPYNQGNGGQLSQDPNQGAIHYTTSGGYNVTINNGQVTVQSPSGTVNTYQQTNTGNQRGPLTQTGSTTTAPEGSVSETGDPHENVTGVQNPQGAEATWSADHRELILGDGTVIDMKATAANGTINQVNIFDGNEEVNVGTGGAGGNTIKNVDYDPYKTYQDESQVPTDNEAYFGYGYDGKLRFEQLDNMGGVPIPQQLQGLRGAQGYGQSYGPGNGYYPGPVVPLQQVRQPQQQQAQQQQQQNHGAPLWSWILFPPGALTYDIATNSGVGRPIDNAVGGAFNWVNNNVFQPIGNFFGQGV